MLKRSKRPSFVRIDRELLAGPWRSLKPVERALLVELMNLYNGHNNGKIALSTRDASELCNVARGTAAKAFIRLEAFGLIQCMSKGGFSRHSPRASEWRLTFWMCNVSARPGSTRWPPPTEH
jgi:hypothetical protein